MMTLEMMMAIVTALGADASMWYDEEDCVLNVTLRDFAGFDENWSEIMRDYDHPEAVEAFEEMLEAKCLSHEGDFYFDYHFDGFTVELGYDSYNI